MKTEQESNVVIQHALDLLDQTEDREQIDAGFRMLQKMADNGDMTAAAHLGYAYQFRHLGHFDLDLCREYLEKAVAADDPTGQYFLGSMLMCGDAPFQEDKVRGRWLLEESKKTGNKDAEQFLATWDMKMTPQEAKKMLLKSRLKLLWERIHPKKAAEDPDDNQNI